MIKQESLVDVKNNDNLHENNKEFISGNNTILDMLL